MTKPHEETWYADADGAVYVGTGPNRMTFLEPSAGPPDDMPERGRLAAQAPAMARLLLEGEWLCEERGDMCRHCGRLRPEDHAADCEFAVVLRAAGVLP